MAIGTVPAYKAVELGQTMYRQGLRHALTSIIKEQAHTSPRSSEYNTLARMALIIEKEIEELDN